jgi:hypothetical protein
MRIIDDLKVFNGLLMKPKPSAEKERLAKRHEQQRRERKEKLYSFSSNNH